MAWFCKGHDEALALVSERRKALFKAMPFSKSRWELLSCEPERKTSEAVRNKSVRRLARFITQFNEQHKYVYRLNKENDPWASQRLESENWPNKDVEDWSRHAA